jgi:molybdenum-dependent DNA-binding transcriptional regulator ModE
LVAHSTDGRIETVYYQFLAPMLLNEFQKQQRTIQTQAAELTKQKLEIAKLRRQTARIALLEKQTERMATLLGRLETTGTISTAGR